MTCKVLSARNRNVFHGNITTRHFLSLPMLPCIL